MTKGNDKPEEPLAREARPAEPPPRDAGLAEKAPSGPLLLVSDRSALREKLASLLRQSGYEVVECPSRQEGLRMLKGAEARVSLVELSGKEGASSHPAWRDAEPGKKKSAEPAQIAGSSELIQSLRRLVERLAPTELSLLVSGEIGTGKKHVAQVIHQASSRRELSLVTLDSITFSESALENILFGSPAGVGPRGKTGLLGLPEVGTIFLGAIESLSLPLQRKLLLAIEEGVCQPAGDAHTRPVTARLICGTSRNLSEEVDAGRMLYDLYSRLSLYELRIPPLRERVQDLPVLVRSLLERQCRLSNRVIPAVDRDAEQALLDSPWPGNVRELSNVLERTLSLLDGHVIRLADLPNGPYRMVRRVENLREARQRFELEHIHQTLVRAGGDKHKAADILGLDISSLYRMLRLPRRA